MTIDVIKDVITEFTKRLLLPNAIYSFGISSDNEFIELNIKIDNEIKMSISISNGTLKVLYSDEYKSQDYIALTFLTPITLVYQLCILFFTCVGNENLDFNDLLSVVFLNEITDWKSLLQGIAENCNMRFVSEGEYVLIDDIDVHYFPFTNKIKIVDTEIKLDDNRYTTLVEGLFATVEYIANLMDKADDLFVVEEEVEDNLITDEEAEDEEFGNMPSGGGDFDVDVDVNEDVAEEVPPMPNEDFSEPQETVVTTEDVL